MSTSLKKLPIVNENCALRRNVRVQPYGRCTVCTMQLRQCHAWQSSALSFVLVVLLLVPIVWPDPWAIRASMLLALAALVFQGVANHARTDQIIFGAHELTTAKRSLEVRNVELDAARRGLEAEVEVRTARLRETNVALARANLELADIATQREKLLLDVSHDLRTPLTSVKGASQNLLDGIAGPLSADQREYVEIARDHAERLITAVTSLLDRARAPASPVTLDARAVDLLALATDVARSLLPIAEERGVRIEISGDRSETLADPVKLRHVIENVLGNALKFTDHGGAVAIETSHDDREVRLVVRDTGIGMNDAQLATAFERFRHSDERAGSGLGLAITRDLVRLHEGEVSMKSRPGRGTELTVSLPRRAA